MKRLFNIFRKDRKLFLLAVLAGVTLVMPLSVNLVNVRTSFFPRADKIPELRLWLEPATVITKPNQKVQFKIFANFDGQNLVLPDLKTSVVADMGLGFMPAELYFPKPFRGQTEVGMVEAVPNQTGKFNLTLSLVSTGLDKQLDVKISPATIIAK